MSFSAVGSVSSAAPIVVPQATAKAAPTPAVAALPQAALAPDGDTQQVEAAESAATRQAEKLGGGIAPSTASTNSTGGVNKLV